MSEYTVVLSEDVQSAAEEFGRAIQSATKAEQQSGLATQHMAWAVMCAAERGVQYNKDGLSRSVDTNHIETLYKKRAGHTLSDNEPDGDILKEIDKVLELTFVGEPIKVKKSSDQSEIKRAKEQRSRKKMLREAISLAGCLLSRDYDSSAASVQENKSGKTTFKGFRICVGHLLPRDMVHDDLNIREGDCIELDNSKQISVYRIVQNNDGDKTKKFDTVRNSVSNFIKANAPRKDKEKIERKSQLNNALSLVAGIAKQSAPLDADMDSKAWAAYNALRAYFETHGGKQQDNKNENENDSEAA